MPNQDPWYTRTEFWTTIATIIIGFLGTKSQNPTVQNIGATMAGLGPIVYTWGRSNVKVQQAANALNAVGTVLEGPKP